MNKKTDGNKSLAVRTDEKEKTQTTDRNINGYELLNGNRQIYCLKIRKNWMKSKLRRWLKELNLRRPKRSLRWILKNKEQHLNHSAQRAEPNSDIVRAKWTKLKQWWRGCWCWLCRNVPLSPLPQQEMQSTCLCRFPSHLLSCDTIMAFPPSLFTLH